MDPFQEQIRAALTDPALQAALDANAARRLDARTLAYASLPRPWDVMRAEAHAARTEIIANLEEHLDNFAAEAAANGFTVHRAADAQAAVEIVLQIAFRRQARLVAKSKTMVGEEIGINHALEALGIQALETDLGEYIVQLREERPAHIITPAVHLSRAQVARTFEEKLHTPYTEDVESLTAVARQVLRQAFLDADIGISGVNFGVADSGAICLVTNEGNGRMVTTLPKVHIALMGIERLVRDYDDLALMLALLTRSATGQKMTVYTSLIHSPRSEQDLDGPEERHLILLDNGRQAMRGSWLEEALLCIRCGACLNACPVFREIGGHAYVSARGEERSPYPGPIGSIVSPGLFGQESYGNLARATSLCGACREACPVDIDLPGLLLRVRAGGLEAGRKPGPPERHAPPALRRGLGLYSWAAAHPAVFRLAQDIAGFFGRLAAPRSGGMRMPAWTGWGANRDFPRPAVETFRQRWEKGKVRQENIPAPAPVTDPAGEPTAHPQVESGSALDAPKLLDRFSAEWVALGGVFETCTEAELGPRMLEAVRAYSLDRLQAWDAAHLPSGLLEELQAAGITVQTGPDPAIHGGLTGASGAIAETGTLILESGPGRSQTASLLPEIHLVVLRAGQIVPDLAHAARVRRDAWRKAPAVHLISGPSRTADIEMTLTIGVHGPRQVHVFCVVAE